MDGRGGCCIVRHATGAHNMSTMERIMLRFRPIAPKPVTGSTASDGSSSESGDAFFKGGRTKRKYVKNNNNTEKQRVRRKKTVASPEKTHPMPVKVPVPVTLPLLPETPNLKDPPAGDLTLTAASKVRDNNNNNNGDVDNLNRSMPRWLSFENRSKVEAAEPVPYWCYGAMDPVTVSLGGGYSSVIVESVTDTWVEGEGLGNTDEERSAKLSVDTCPGFVSDGYGRVTWINGAFREMMGEGIVALVMKASAVVLSPSFTCRVRVVQFACGTGRERNSLTVPCDVWRMDCGGFAWRLDVKTALSLGLGC